MRKMLLAAALGLGLVACSGVPVSPEQRMLQACEAYGDVLEKVLVWKDLGRLMDTELSTLRATDDVVGPQCVTAVPNPDFLSVVESGGDALEAILVDIIRREQASE